MNGKVRPSATSASRAPARLEPPVTSEIVTYPLTETAEERKRREALKKPQPTYSYTVTGRDWR